MKTSLKGKAAWLGKSMSVQKTTAPAQPSNRLTGWSGSLGNNIYYWVKNEYLHSYTTLSASSPPGRAELVAEQELGKLDRTVEVRQVSRQPVHQQEDVAGPGHPVAQPRTLPQEPLPPDAGGGPGERRHVRLLAPHQPGPRQQRHRAARAVAPVHQLVTVLPRLLPLNKYCECKLQMYVVTLSTC